MNIIVSNSADVPLYMQIKEQIKEAYLKRRVGGRGTFAVHQDFANEFR